MNAAEAAPEDRLAELPDVRVVADGHVREDFSHRRAASWVPLRDRRPNLPLHVRVVNPEHLPQEPPEPLPPRDLGEQVCHIMIGCYFTRFYAKIFEYARAPGSAKALRLGCVPQLAGDPRKQHRKRRRGVNQKFYLYFQSEKIKED